MELPGPNYNNRQDHRLKSDGALGSCLIPRADISTTESCKGPSLISEKPEDSPMSGLAPLTSHGGRKETQWETAIRNQENFLASVSNTDLCTALSTSFVWRMWLITRILLKRIPSLNTAIDEAHNLVVGLDDERLADLYRLHSREIPIAFLRVLTAVSIQISAEMTRRTDSYKCREIIRYKLKKANAPWLLPLLKLTRTDRIRARKTKPWHVEDDEDLALLAVEAVVNHGLGQKYAVNLKSPPSAFPDPRALDLPNISAQDSALIDRRFKPILQGYTQSILKEYLPILNGDLEQSAPTIAREALRAHWRKRKRRDTDRVDVTDLETVGAEGTDPNLTLNLRRMLEEAASLKHSGPKAVKVLQYLLAGYTEKEAAKRVGMTTRNLRYLGITKAKLKKRLRS